MLTATLRSDGPFRRVDAGLVEDPRAEMANEPRLFRDAYEAAGQQEASLGVVPADERLEAHQLGRLGVVQRLVVKHELLALNGLAQLDLQGVGLLHLLVHRRLEGSADAAALRLRPIERQIGIADEFVRRPSVLGIHRHAHAGADRHAMAMDMKLLRKLRDHALGQLLGVLAAAGIGLQDDELVAAEAGDQHALLRASLQPLGDAAEQLVADGMSERVVDGLEAVEIDAVNGEGARATLLGKQGVHLVGQQPAVRQAGQRVVGGDVLDLRRALFHPLLQQGGGAPLAGDGAHHEHPAGHGAERQSEDGGFRHMLHGADRAHLDAVGEIAVGQTGPQVPGADVVVDVERNGLGIDEALVGHEVGREARSLAWEGLAGGIAARRIDDRIAVVGQHLAHHGSQHDGRDGAFQRAVLVIERHGEDHAQTVRVLTRMDVVGVVAGDHLAAADQWDLHTIYAGDGRIVDLQPGQLLHQLAVLVDLDFLGRTLELLLVELFALACSVPAGAGVDDQLVELDDRHFALAGRRVDPIGIEIGREDVDLRYRHVAGEVVVDVLDRGVGFRREVLAMAVDRLHARQEADRSQVLVDGSEGHLDMPCCRLGIGARIVDVAGARQAVVVLDVEVDADGDRDADEEDQRVADRGFPEAHAALAHPQ